MEPGTKLTMLPEESPSQQVIAAGNAEVVVTDTTGRTFTLKKPGVLAQFKLIEMLGNEASQNQFFVYMVFPLMYITAIDGEPVSRFTTRRELDALIQRLEAAGVEAVSQGVQTHFGAAVQADKDVSVKN